MLDILFEDNHIIVVNKPQNVPTQSDTSGDKDLLTMVKEYIKEKYNKPGNVYVGLVHRLDRPTGGVLVFAKTSKAAARLSEQIKDGTMQKTYLCVVEGVPQEPRAELFNYLKKSAKENKVRVVPAPVDGAKDARLSYEMITANEKFSLLKINLGTGRSHQIRVQLSNIKLPIYGDAKYGAHPKANIALYSSVLKFEHPTTKQLLTFKVCPPVDKLPWKTFENSIYKELEI